jgi:hypothetical protein
MKPAAAMILVAGLSTMAQAQTGKLTLACNGTTTVGTDAATPGLVDLPVKITGVNDVTVSFVGNARLFGSNWNVTGSIDRVTGGVGRTLPLRVLPASWSQGQEWLAESRAEK